MLVISSPLSGFCHCGAHTAEQKVVPIGTIPPILITKHLLFLWHVVNCLALAQVPYITTLRNGSASTVPAYTNIHNNFFVGNYGLSQALD